MSVKILIGDVRERLRALPDESVDCVVTSPPYWGLRDYGIGGQLGMESTWQEHVDGMVAVFREVRRVLKKTGTLWLNYGDTYAASVNGRSAADTKALTDDDRTFRDKPFSTVQGVLKPKDLCGIPWRVAFALQADGWYLRQDIIWSKPNPMPESITDRCTKAHEYIFLMAKSARYFYDAEAVAEPVTLSTLERIGQPNLENQAGSGRVPGKTNGNMKAVGGDTRNRRSVWTIATQPFSEAHFATFPPELAETCIKAGCPEKCCSKCGAPWVREVERTPMVIDRSERTHDKGQTRASGTMLEPARAVTLGFSPSCKCNAEATPGTVLDPFGGAGTTGLVADRLGRNAILIELNPQYAELARKRVYNDLPMFVDVAAE